MAYEVGEEGVRWKGRLVRGADPASFQVLPGPPSGALARDEQQVFWLGKPAAVDSASFELLSPGYARDAAAVYQVMEAKLKPVKHADPKSFEALGAAFGRDARQCFFRGKRLRVSKQGRAERLAPLGHVYAHDGAVLFFGTQQLQPPAEAEVDWARARLTWFGDENEVNVPPLGFDDGQAVWFAPSHPSAERWLRLEGADFDRLALFPEVPGIASDRGYVQDGRSIWYLGRCLEGADPGTARLLGRQTLEVDGGIWAGERWLSLATDEVTVFGHHSLGPPDRAHGDLAHDGRRVLLLGPGQAPRELAVAGSPAGGFESIARAALHALFERLFTIFDHFVPLVWTPRDIFGRLRRDRHIDSDQPEIPASKLPVFQVQLDADDLVVTLEDGVRFRQPVACWYTLGSHLWCHARGRAPELLLYPSVNWLPKGDELQQLLLAEQRSSMLGLASAVYRSGAEEAARELVHALGARSFLRQSHDEESLVAVAGLPRALVSELVFDPPHHHFESTTNLAVARQIVREGWLEHPDFRARLDVLSVLCGTVIETNKKALFHREIIPAVLARYEHEPSGLVREHLAYVLEASLIAGQVDGEVNQIFHSEALLPIVEFCISKGIHTRFNRARLAETLWALDRVEEGDRAKQAFLEDYGDEIVLPGVYAHRYTYRRAELWLLAAKLRIAWRKGQAQEHQRRLADLEAGWEAILERYGSQVLDWDEVKDMSEQIARYRDAQR